MSKRDKDTEIIEAAGNRIQFWSLPLLLFSQLASATSIKNYFENSDEEELLSSVNESGNVEQGRSSETVIVSDNILLFLFNYLMGVN